MTLPYDYARCNGAGDPQCKYCLRRTSPGRPDGWQTHTSPLFDGKGNCERLIKQQDYEGWK